MQVTQEFIFLSPTAGQHSSPVLSKGNLSLLCPWPNPLWPIKDNTSVILPSLSLLDHSHQPTNVPLFLLSLIIILIASNSPKVIPDFSIFSLVKKFLQTVVFIWRLIHPLPWNFKASPAWFLQLPQPLKRALSRSPVISTLLNPVVSIQLWYGFIGHHSVLVFLLPSQALSPLLVSPLLYKFEVPQGPPQLSFHFNLMLITPGILSPVQTCLLGLRHITNDQLNLNV